MDGSGARRARDRCFVAPPERRPAAAADDRGRPGTPRDIRIDSGQHAGDVCWRGGKRCGGQWMSTAEHEPSPGAGREPTEEELRAYEAELKQLRIEHVLLEQVVTLVNLGMRRTGLAAGTEDERDTGQVQLAIEAIRGLVPLLEKV